MEEGRSELEGGDRSVVREQLVVLDDELADFTEDESRNDVILDLAECTDRANQTHLSERNDDCTAPGEIAPLKGAVVVLLLHHVLGEVEHTESHIQGAEELELLLGLHSVAKQWTELADGVGDVAMQIGTPTTSEPHEFFGLVPDVPNGRLRRRHQHGEAEAVLVLHEALPGQYVDDVFVLGQKLAQVDLEAVFTGIDLVERHGGHVQQAAGHGVSLGARVVYLIFYDDDVAIIHFYS